MNVHSACLERIHNYQQAKAFYESVVPYRSGSDKGKRPLGRRRYNYCQIHQYDETNAIALRLYGSDVVTIFPNDEFQISLCKWDTVSTRQFISACTPFAVKYDRGTTFLQVEGGWYPFKNSEEPLIVRDYKVIDPTPQIVHKLNRAAMRDIHKRYGAFREYVANMGKLLVGIQETELTAAFGTAIERRNMHLALPSPSSRYFYGVVKPVEHLKDFLHQVEVAQANDDLEKFYALFLRLGVSTLRYNSFVKTYVAGWSDDVAIGGPMLKYFDEILKHIYKEDLFVVKEVPIGEVKANTNRKYFL